MRPTLFIGSSSESLDVAYSAQKNLEDVAEVIVWTQDIFEISKFYLEALLEALNDTEFGLFIFGPDDTTKIRGEEKRTARDNVVFELGLFIGRLGRDRSFILMPRGVPDFHLPSDLLGISTATYQPPARSDRLQAALGPACHDIRTAIRKHAASPEKVVPPAQDMSLLFGLVIPEAEKKHLLNLARGKTTGYKGSGILRSELRHLRSVGLVQKKPGRNIGELTSDRVVDLADFVELTSIGREWIGKLEAKS